jgi:hypothetical protein
VVSGAESLAGTVQRHYMSKVIEIFGNDTMTLLAVSAG